MKGVYMMTGKGIALKSVSAILVVAFTMFLSTVSCFAFNDDNDKEPPADSVKLYQESEKKFHVSKHGPMIELREGLSKPYLGKPEEAADAFLKDYHDMFELSRDVSEFKLEKVERVLGDYRVKYRRHYKGVPFFLGGASVYLDGHNRIKRVTIGVLDEKELTGLKTNPNVKLEELQELLEKTHPELGHIHGTPELVIYKRDGDYILAYVLIVAVNEKQRRFWDMIVDADTGEILVKRKGWLED